MCWCKGEDSKGVGASGRQQGHLLSESEMLRNSQMGRTTFQGEQETLSNELYIQNSNVDQNQRGNTEGTQKQN